jgi:nucleoside-diphosphate-sugar epimerase
VNALVTGGGGFLGQYIVERLVRRGDRVAALCRRKCPLLESLGVHVILGDLRDRQAVADACRGVDTVFHVGGIAGMGGPWRLYRDTNVLGTQNVVDGCLASGAGRLIYTSSPSVAFNGRDQCGIDESVPYARRWLCCYARSKALGEQIVLAANGRSGLRTCALRPHLIWGPRDRHVIPTIIDAARHGRLRRIGDGTNRIDTVYVENAAAAHLAAADALVPDSPVPGQAYFISQGEPVNCWAWIDELLALAGLPPVRKSVPRPLAYAFGAMWEAIYATFRLRGDPPMTRFLALQFATSHYFDIARAKRDFGYEPTISTAEGMRRLGEEELVPVSRHPC